MVLLNVIFLPAIVSLIGLALGPFVARRVGSCPHAGRVHGAFLLPLMTMLFPDLQILGLMVSLGGALGAGLTAHRSWQVSFLVTLGAVSLATIGYQFSPLSL